jgi:hypothetical protein
MGNPVIRVENLSKLSRESLLTLPQSHAHRFGVFVAVGRNRQEVDERADWVYRTFKIVTEPV